MPRSGTAALIATPTGTECGFTVDEAVSMTHLCPIQPIQPPKSAFAGFRFLQRSSWPPCTGGAHPTVSSVTAAESRAGARRHVGQEAGELGDGERPGQVEPLSEVAAEGPEGFDLAGLLDALGHCLEVHGLSQAIADGFNGFIVHLENHDVAFSATSLAPITTMRTYKRRMGWTFPWVSSLGGDFNFDFNVSFTAEQQQSREVLESTSRHGTLPVPWNPAKDQSGTRP